MKILPVPKQIEDKPTTSKSLLLLPQTDVLSRTAYIQCSMLTRQSYIWEKCQMWCGYQSEQTSAET